MGVVMIIVMMVVPLPTVLIDLLIATNITGALLIVLVSMYVKRPLDFSGFPSLLLVMTLFRLALNVSATRLVLLDGFAGKVIDAFGHFVVGGQLVIGLVIFMILIVIQFVVITKGAERVAEVGARFTLDAMPGKQMAIDADLNAGLIDEDEARRRRTEVRVPRPTSTARWTVPRSSSRATRWRPSSSRLINLIGGFAVGMVQKRPVADATRSTTYSLLSVGDGLVSQIPALLLSVATGLIVTRSATDGDMGSNVAKQLGQHRVALRIAGGAALGLCLIPGLPKLPFLVVGTAVLVIAQRLPATRPGRRGRDRRSRRRRPPTRPRYCSARCGSTHSNWRCRRTWSTWSTRAGGDLLDRVRALRRKVALDLGIVMPPVRTRDDLDLPLSTYAIRISGIDVAQRPGPARYGPRDRREPGLPARQDRRRAGVRPGRQVGAGRAAAPGRA